MGVKGTKKLRKGQLCNFALCQINFSLPGWGCSEIWLISCYDAITEEHRNWKKSHAFRNDFLELCATFGFREFSVMWSHFLPRLSSEKIQRLLSRPSVPWRRRTFTSLKNPRAKADIWKHFGVKKRKSDGSFVEPSFAFCLTCKSGIKLGGGTSNLQQHVCRHHPQLLSSSVPKSTRVLPSAATSSTVTTEEPTASKQQRQQSVAEAFSSQAKKTKYLNNSVRAREITKQIATFLVKDLRPYSLVDSPHFRVLLAKLDDRYNPPSRTHFSEAVIPDMYLNVREKVLADIQKTEHVSTDTVTE